MLRSRYFARACLAVSVAGLLSCGDNLPFNIWPGRGNLSLDGGSVVLTFPPNAISERVQVKAIKLTGVGGTTVVTGYEFQPSMTFAVPVHVAIKYGPAALPAGVRQAELGLYKLVNGTLVKDSGSTVDSAGKTVTAWLTGFSQHLVAGAPVAAVLVSPSPASVGVGKTVQLAATPEGSDGDTLPDRPVTWGNLHPAIASVNDSGLVTGVSPGTDTITATSDSAIGNAVVTVTVQQLPVHSVTVSPPVDTVTVSGTGQLSATLKDSLGNTLSGRAVSWRSSDTTIAKVDSTGVTVSVHGVAAGAATVTATSEGKSGTAAITVKAQQLPVASVAVAPLFDTITVSGTGQLSATLKDSLGNTLSGRVVTWRSSDTTIAKVDSTGVTVSVHGVAVGAATATATSEGKSGSASITVQPASSDTVVFADSFDTGALAGAQNGYRWGTTDKASSGLLPVVSNVQHHSGSYSLAFSFGPDGPGGQSMSEQYFDLGAYLTEVWIEFQWYVPSNYTNRNTGGSSYNNKLFYIWRDTYSNKPDPQFAIEFQPRHQGDGTSRIRPLWRDESGTEQDANDFTYSVFHGASDADSPFIGTSGVAGVCQPGQWTRIRIHIKTESAVGANDGQFEIWADTTLMYRRDGGAYMGQVPGGTNTLHNLYLMGYANSGYANQSVFYIDDFKVYGANPGW